MIDSYQSARLILACSLVGFSQGLSASQQCFSLTINQHQSGLSAQKPTSEHALYMSKFSQLMTLLNSCILLLTTIRHKIHQVLYRGIFDLSTKSTRQFYSTILTGRSLEIFLRVSTSEMVSYTLKPCKIQYELLFAADSIWFQIHITLHLKCLGSYLPSNCITFG